MTDVLVDYTGQKVFNEGQDLIELYNSLVKDLHTKINPLKYAIITINVSRQFSNLEDSIKFLEDAKARLVNKNDAVFICKIA